MILFAGVCAGPVVAADVATVTTMAQQGSGVTLDKLSLAVYEAVKAQPDKAVDIFRGVISQRSNWSVTETYAVLRSVLLAAPGLEAGFVQGADSFSTGGYTAAAIDTMGSQLLASLYTMPQTHSVAAAVVQGVVGSSTVARAAGNGVSQQTIEAYVPAAPSAPVVPEYPVTPTPPPTSANN